MNKKRKSYNVPEDKYLKLERIAVEVSQRLGKSIKWSEVITYLIDNYAKDVTNDMIHSTKKQ